jgi:hypothetical protein
VCRQVGQYQPNVLAISIVTVEEQLSSWYRKPERDAVGDDPFPPTAVPTAAVRDRPEDLESRVATTNGISLIPTAIHRPSTKKSGSKS